MTKSFGKQFEENFKNSVPDYCFLYRIRDAKQGYVVQKNPCDFFMFDDKMRILFCLELKSTKGKRMTFDKNEDDEKQKTNMIKYHQIKALTDFCIYDNLSPAFLFNFRDEKNDSERTYYQDITSFNNMIKKINKSSFNEMDLILNKAKKIECVKKRKTFRYDIEGFLNEYMNCKGGN